MENYLWCDTSGMVHFIGFQYLYNHCYLQITDNIIVLSSKTLPEVTAEFELNLSRANNNPALQTLFNTVQRRDFYYEEQLEIYVCIQP
ncbi:hypothetical protein [Butyrivibrio sp.]|uniref:hypothetical protein n=1 Tax=Butyrivibrio sp. TaxID=28121 RepID=UPI0025B92B6B|nr:hypothetical protein [Butyrivibrio sp.]MBQ9303466.1 hypothetical protein [Butyrivibrio sp.]